MTLIPESDPQEEIERLRAEITALQADLRTARATPDDTDISELRRQLDLAQQELAQLRPAPVTPPRVRRLDGFFEVEESE